MKKSLLVVIFILSVSYSLEAQWYSRACNVIDIETCSDEEFECMWNKASKMARQGAVTTVLGSSLIVVGGVVLVASGFGEIGHAALALSMIGVLIDIMGAPAWITGAIRKSQLRKNPHFNTLNLQALNFSPIIYKNQFNSTYSVGLTASIRF